MTILKLKLIKEYVDAKAEYDRNCLGVSGGLFTVSASLTPAGEAIRDRFRQAENALNAAIKLEEIGDEGDE